MIVPFLKSNGKFSLYNTSFDFKKDDREFKHFGDNTNHRKIMEDEYDFINEFIEGFAIANKGNKSYFLNQKGEKIQTKFEYDSIRNFENGIAKVCREYAVDYPRYRFINKNGIEIIDDSFEEYSFLKKGFIEVTKYSGYYHSGHYSDSINLSPSEFSNGLMDYTGYMIIEPMVGARYTPMGKFIKVVISSERSSRTYYYDYNGMKINDSKFDNFEYIDSFYEGKSLSQLKQTKEYVIIDEDLNIHNHLGIFNHLDIGEVHTPYEDFFYCHFMRGLCPIRKNNKWGYINLDGKVVLDFIYDYIEPFSDIKSWTYYTNGCAVVGKIIDNNLKYGAITSDFKEITNFIFDEVKNFHEGIASVRIGSKWGCINSKGEVIIPIEFTFVLHCINGFIEVGLGDFEGSHFVGNYGFFDKYGNKITKIIYQSLYPFKHDHAIFKKDNKYGLINKTGIEIIKSQYDDLSYISQNLYLAYLNDVKFYIDINGRKFISNEFNLS